MGDVKSIYHLVAILNKKTKNVVGTVRTPGATYPPSRQQEQPPHNFIKLLIQHCLPCIQNISLLPQCVAVLLIMPFLIAKCRLVYSITVGQPYDFFLNFFKNSVSKQRQCVARGFQSGDTALAMCTNGYRGFEFFWDVLELCVKFVKVDMLSDICISLNFTCCMQFSCAGWPHTHKYTHMLFSTWQSATVPLFVWEGVGGQCALCNGGSDQLALCVTRYKS